MLTVLLHALPFDGRMWSDADRQINTNVLAPDLFRLGNSIGDWAEAVLAMTGSEEMLVVGSSVGGSCALEIARLAPKQVSAIVLIGSKASVRPDPIARDQAIRTLETEGMDAAWSAYWAPLFGTSTPRSVLSSARELAWSQDVHQVASGVRAFHDRRDLSGFAASWRKPFIVISGDQDRTPPSAAIRALGRGPKRRFHIVEDCGHYVNLERPQQLQSILVELHATIARTSIRASTVPRV
jgi:pimeloyl-ACP methyl ester carboxylesterase